MVADFVECRIYFCNFFLTSSLIISDENTVSGTIPSEIGKTPFLEYLIMGKPRQASFIYLLIHSILIL